jgi:hypothetical protein
MIAGVDDDINFAGVARNTTYKNDINTSKKVEISECKPSKTLVEFVDNTTQAKNRKKMATTSLKSTYKTRSIWPKNKENNEIIEIKEGKDKEEGKSKELSIKYCPTNATLADLLTKPLTKANIHKIRKTIKSIIGQQKCIGENNNNKVPVQCGLLLIPVLVPVLVLVLQEQIIINNIPLLVQ